MNDYKESPEAWRSREDGACGCLVALAALVLLIGGTAVWVVVHFIRKGW